MSENALEERCDPTGRNDYLSQQHVQRYQFVIPWLWKRARVLDSACGVGYGSGLLAKTGADVIGVDIDPHAIDAAKASYPGLTFQQGDALSLPFEDNSFDVIVSFETVEHVIDGQMFLTEIKRVLAPDGFLIISTPNIKYTSHPEYHLKEYEPEEFFRLIEKNFPVVDTYAQYFLSKDRLADAITRLTPQGIKSLLHRRGLKTRFRSILRGEKFNGKPSSEPSQPADSPYAVVPFNSKTRNLRIMLCVAKMSSIC